MDLSWLCWWGSYWSQDTGDIITYQRDTILENLLAQSGAGGGLLAGVRKLWGGGQQQIITFPPNIDKNIIFPGFHLTALIKYRKYDKKMFYGYKNKTSQS